MAKEVTDVATSLVPSDDYKIPVDHNREHRISAVIRCMHAASSEKLIDPRGDLYCVLSK